MTQQEKAERSRQIANTIISQMGGFGKLKAMVNGRKYVATEDGVQFQFSGSRKVNKCVVILDPSDTYTFQLWKIGAQKFELVYTLSGVYCDMLVDLFESETGLYLSL